MSAVPRGTGTGGPPSADPHLFHPLDGHHVPAVQLPAAALLRLAVHRDDPREEDVLHLGAGGDGVDELQQLAEADGVLAGPDPDGAHAVSLRHSGWSSSPVRTTPGLRTAARTASSPSRSRWIVLSTDVSRPMPPGCGRVVITHRAMPTPNLSRTSPRSASCPSSSASPSPSSRTLARNRRRSQCPSVPVETSDSRIRGLS